MCCVNWMFFFFPLKIHVALDSLNTQKKLTVCSYITKYLDQGYRYTKGDPRTCAIFIPTWGSNWGLRSSRNHNNRGSSGAYVTCIYCSLSVKINMRKTPHGVRRSWTHLFLHVWSAKNGRLQFEPHGWQRHYTGWYKRSGISLVCLWSWANIQDLTTQLRSIFATESMVLDIGFWSRCIMGTSNLEHSSW